MAERTNDLLSAVLDDIKLQPPGPVLIVGDLNGDLANFKCLQKYFEKKDLIDVGGQTQRWNRQEPDFTCRAPGSH